MHGNPMRRSNKNHSEYKKYFTFKDINNFLRSPRIIKVDKKFGTEGVIFTGKGMTGLDITLRTICALSPANHLKYILVIPIAEASAKNQHHPKSQNYPSTEGIMSPHCWNYPSSLKASQRLRVN